MIRKYERAAINWRIDSSVMNAATAKHLCQISIIWYLLLLLDFKSQSVENVTKSINNKKLSYRRETARQLRMST